MPVIYNGSLNLIIGSMFSGKTGELIRRCNRYTIGGKKCFMIKYKNDNRYDGEMIATHDGIKVPALICEYLYEADKIIDNYDVICVDEVQFYKDAVIFCDKWANQGKIVEASGLNGTFNRTEFPIISRLIPLSQDIVFLKAVCKETGNDAVYSNINVPVDKGIIEVIGGDDKYNAVDRLTFFNNQEKKVTDMKNKIREYIDIDLNNDKRWGNHKKEMELIEPFINMKTDFINNMIIKPDFKNVLPEYIRFLEAMRIKEKIEFPNIV